METMVRSHFYSAKRSSVTVRDGNSQTHQVFFSLGDLTIFLELLLIRTSIPMFPVFLSGPNKQWESAFGLVGHIVSNFPRQMQRPVASHSPKSKAGYLSGVQLDACA